MTVQNAVEGKPDYLAAAGWLCCAFITAVLVVSVLIPLVSRLERYMKSRVYRMNNLPPDQHKMCVCGSPKFMHNDDEDGYCLDGDCGCTKFRPVRLEEQL
jgi:hypothetical protein